MVEITYETEKVRHVDIELYPDDDLVKEYGNKNNDNGGNGKKIVIPPPVSRIDKKPMGA